MSNESSRPHGADPAEALHGEALVAMPADERRQRLAAELELAGFHCRLVSSGLYALTMLERQQPTLVICGSSLDDMQGAELLEIVRSDDHLREVGFILLSDRLNSGDVAPASATERDVQLDAASPPGALVRASLLLSDPASASRAFGELGNVLLSGSLDVFDFGGLLMLIRAGRKCGLLHMMIAENRALFVIVRGRLVHAEAGGKLGEAALAWLWPQLSRDATSLFAFEGLEPAALTRYPVTITRSLENILLHLSVTHDEQLEGRHHG